MLCKNFCRRKINFVFFISFIFLFLSCENFLTGNGLRQDLEEKLKYANAESVSVLVLAENQTGTIIPSGNHSVKVGYDFELQFKESPAYQFVRWMAVVETTGKETDVVSFEDAESPETCARLESNTSGIKIYPFCIERIAVAGEPSPKWESKGVGRDRSITVQFSKKPALSSFIFSEKEVPADAVAVRNTDGSIYAFIKNERTYFKNISITNDADISIAEHFNAPEIKDNLLIIEVNKQNPIEIEIGETYKTVRVSLGSEIKDESGVSMKTPYAWNYRVSNVTDEKAHIKLSAGKDGDKFTGSVYMEGERDYNLSQTIALSFTENADYQFIKWNYDSSIVSVADPYSISTTAVVNEKSDGTEITAVCAKRLRVNSFFPVNDAENKTVSKNSSIIISFSNDIPKEPEDLTQLKNITITVGGVPVRSCFSDPVVTGSSVSFAASSLNMIDVNEGQTKVVEVTVPSDFYYRLEDGTKITYGGTGIAFSYIIDHTTLEKTEITFVAPENSGVMTPSGSSKMYSIGQEISLKFEPANGYIFNGWKITSAGLDVDESKIKIADKSNPNTKLYIYDALPAVVVSADCSEILTVANSFELNSIYPKDSDIILTFNKKLDESCLSFLGKINVSINGANIDSNFSERTLSEKTITLKNTRLLDVTGNEVKTVTVTVPSVFFYKDNDRIVELKENYSFDYRIDSTTIAKSKICFSVVNGETNVYIAGNTAGTLSFSSYEEFDIGQTVALGIDMDNKYQFYGWNVQYSNGESVPSSIIKINDSTINKTNLVLTSACQDIMVEAVVYKRPELVNYVPKPANAADAVPKNSLIEMQFDHELDSSVKNNVLVSYSNGDINKDSYFASLIDSTLKIITLSPVKFLSLAGSTETVRITLPQDKFYYLAKDNKTPIYMYESKNWEYKINNSTINKTTIRFAIDENSISSTNQVFVDGTVVSSGYKDSYNVEQNIKLRYSLQNGYLFKGWKIISHVDGYTVSSSEYLNTGIITVKSSAGTYLTMTVDGTSAEVVVNEAIASGINDQAISIMACDTLIPRIEDFFPMYASNGVSCDESIKITFNTAMNKNTVVWKNTLKIVNPNNEKETFYEYFENPRWEGNVLIIKPKNIIKNLVPAADDVVTFKIILDTENIYDIAGETLTESDKYNSYKINGVREIDPPVIKALKLYSTDDKNHPFYRELTDKAFSSWNRTQKDSYKYGDFSQNRVNKFYFNLSGYDIGSGINSVKIIEKRKTDMNGNTVIEDEYFTEYSLSDFKTDGVYENSNLYKLEKNYSFKSTGDGIVTINFVLYDNAGKSVSKEFSVLKDTSNKNFANVRNKYIQTGNLKDTEELKAYAIPFIEYNSNGTVKEIDFDALEHFTTNQRTFKYSVSMSSSYYISLDVVDENGTVIKPVFSKLFNPTNTSVNNVLKSAGIKINPEKNSYFKFYSWSESGYYEELVFVIPKAPTVANVRFDATTGKIISYDVSDVDFLFDSTVNCYNYLFYTYQESESYEPGELTWVPMYNTESYMSGTTNKGVWTPNTYMEKDGIYTFYMLRRIADKGNSSVSALSTFGTPYKIYKNTSGPTDSVVFPKIEIKEKAYPKSKGIVSIVLTDFPNNINYNFVYKATATSSISDVFLSETNVMKLMSGYTYKISMIARDKNGNQVAESAYESFQLADEDNISPFIEYYWRINSGNSAATQRQMPNGIYQSSVPYDLDKDRKTQYTISEIKYYFLPESDQIPNTVSELAKYKENIVKISPEAKDVYLPCDGLPYGQYNFVVALKDSEGNETLYKSDNMLSYRLVPLEPEVQITEKKMNVKAKVLKRGDEYGAKYSLALDNDISKYIETVSYQVLENDEWKFIINAVSSNGSSDRNTFRTLERDSENNYSSKDFDLADTNHFIRLFVYNGYYYGDTQSIYYQPVYIYGDYLKYLTDVKKKEADPSYVRTVPDFVCKNKAWMDVSNGKQIFCDKPAFCHTMYSSVRITEDCGENDHIEWENRGIETGLVSNDTMFTYTNDNLKDIPDGCWYTTICHFADGTVLMTKPVRK